MQNALYFKPLPDKKVNCLLCPHKCIIAEGKQGICRVRSNIDGTLISDNYGKVCSIRFDPIEKKPLYHFHPGSTILSLGTVGCNLHCKFCQNWEISQTCVMDYPYLKDITPEEVIERSAERTDNAGIAYTYNEPTIWFEYMLDIARLAKTKGLKNVSVTNGFISREPLLELLPFMDAFNVDLKGFTDDFYKKITSARLEPVKETILLIHEHDKHLEITNLIVTGLNDDAGTFEEMVSWIASETGPDTPLHLSRYFPDFKMDQKSTPIPVLLNFYEIARRYLHFVYLGNVSLNEGRTTSCPNCKSVVIERNGYSTYKTGLNASGNCKFCGTKIIRFM
jgi:pyruvate formate lyase activating enzyme